LQAGDSPSPERQPALPPESGLPLPETGVSPPPKNKKHAKACFSLQSAVKSDLFGSMVKTKSKSSAAGLIWRGGPAEGVRSDF
jgi:hypothetical protein